MINEPADLTERAKAILAAEIEAGGTLYGIRADGCYIARTKDGDRILKRPPKFKHENRGSEILGLAVNAIQK